MTSLRVYTPDGAYTLWIRRRGVPRPMDRNVDQLRFWSAAGCRYQFTS